MYALDVNVLVDAFRSDSPRHDDIYAWLMGKLAGSEYLLISDVTAVAFLRIVTNRRVWVQPSSIDDAQDFVRILFDATRIRLHHASARQWHLFGEIVREHGLTGNDIPDAFLAASAIDMDAVLVTGDRGFRRFPRLRVLDPLQRSQ